eukprot:GHVR01001596.1.p1 GENE.GHVR01001596.1~~GHVR01001596.1.p1  ORF type:complete len:506 (+),score=113.78 GHVR01001596.1:1505-3022(+)
MTPSVSVSDASPTEYVEEQLNSLEACTGLMQMLVGNLLELSRALHCGTEVKLSFSPGCVSIAEIVRSSLLMNSANAKMRGLKLRVEGLEQISDIVGVIWIDSTRILQCLNNIISNAIKYSSVGEVLLSLESYHVNISEDANFQNDPELPKGWLCTGKYVLLLSVKDGGRGIPRHKLAGLCQDFQQLYTGDIKTGTGLGLSLTALIAKLMGGSLKIDSEGEGKGTVVTLEFPVTSVNFIGRRTIENDEAPVWGGGMFSSPERMRRRRVKTRELINMKDAQLIENFKKCIPPPHIIVVDDDPFNRAATAIVGVQGLRMSSDTLVILEEPLDALKLLIKLTLPPANSYDKNLCTHPYTTGPVLLLTDLNMPDVDGVQLAEASRQWLNFNNLWRSPFLSESVNLSGLKPLLTTALGCMPPTGCVLKDIHPVCPRTGTNLCYCEHTNSGGQAAPVVIWLITALPEIDVLSMRPEACIFDEIREKPLTKYMLMNSIRSLLIKLNNLNRSNE